MNPLTTCGDLYDQRISVCVRVRPLNKKEINRKELSVTTIPTADKIMVGFIRFVIIKTIKLINTYVTPIFCLTLFVSMQSSSSDTKKL